jgi:hypothetical protein
LVRVVRHDRRISGTGRHRAEVPLRKFVGRDDLPTIIHHKNNRKRLKASVQLFLVVVIFSPHAPSGGLASSQ